ncbi:MAG: XRE family transcriptional regulator [Enterococcus canintestini]|uniref:XRE family transcriptional regulator n=1 Tax=Enterococcus canintestini TaxID=317010 RepID=UPI003995A140
MDLAKYVGEQIKKFRERRNMTQDDLAEKLETTRQSISRYEIGERKANQDILFALSDIFGVAVDDFFPAAKEGITTIYNQLVPPRQEKVYNFAERQLEEQNRGNVVRFPKKEKLPTIKNSASAANPTELVYGDTVVEEEEFERVPSSADFAVPIIGDSMEPVIRNGQFVFVKEQPDVEDGEIAIVEIDGDGVTCKEVFKDYENQSIILRSINELYEDRVVSPEQIRIIGKVVF